MPTTQREYANTEADNKIKTLKKDKFMMGGRSVLFGLSGNF